MNLETIYLGLRLRTPLVVSASPLTDENDNVKRMAEAGASAIVFHSLFEEQVRRDRHDLQYYLEQGTESFAESLSYFPRREDFSVGPDVYLEHIAEAKPHVEPGIEPFDAVLDVTEPMGMETLIYFTVEGSQVCGRVNPNAGAQDGAPLRLAVDLNNMHLLNEVTGVVL